MSTVKVSLYIDTINTDETIAISEANNIVNSMDRSMEALMDNDDIVSKIYYVCPLIGKIFVVCDTEGRVKLNTPSTLLASTNIADYKLERIPGHLTSYKEIMVPFGRSVTSAEVLNEAQTLAEEEALKVFPFKLPIVKIVDYNDMNNQTIVLPSVFGSFHFQSVSGIATNGEVIITAG